ncbi:carbohydrate kinase family protein [Embleya scabrispora]|uniref:carbohydrate kinase family protein n=1 Tax=Embleya scabrispora TaxID=159449 RepID=UPI00037EDB45|nr:carbohydrate kinase [Embleya scabrispora]
MIFVVGEAVVDLVTSGHGDTAAHPGGSPANVAVGLGRLGSPVSLLTQYGRDPYGEMLAGHFADSLVTVVGEATAGDLPTSTAIARTDTAGAATYEFALSWDPAPIPDELPAGMVCLHTGSIAVTLEPGATTVRRLLEQARGRCTVSYDPNCRPTLMGGPTRARTLIEHRAALADVVKVSNDDLGWLYPGRDITDVAREWLERGPALVVVTRGAAGSYGVCGSGDVHCPAPTVEVADTVGAGDAFTAGLLDALRRLDLLGVDNAPRLRRLGPGTLFELLGEASLVSALTCARPGADPPTAQEVESHRHNIRNASTDRARPSGAAQLAPSP